MFSDRLLSESENDKISICMVWYQIPIYNKKPVTTNFFYSSNVTGIIQSLDNIQYRWMSNIVLSISQSLLGDVLEFKRLPKLKPDSNKQIWWLRCSFIFMLSILQNRLLVGIARQRYNPKQKLNIYCVHSPKIFVCYNYVKISITWNYARSLLWTIVILIEFFVDG